MSVVRLAPAILVLAGEPAAFALSPVPMRGPDAEPASAERRCEDCPWAGETIVVGSRPVSPDRTQDQLAVPGEKLRESPKPNLLESLAQESASIHVTRRGVGPQGISSGAAGGMSIRGLGGSPNTQVVIVEDGVPDVQGVFGHPIPDAYVPDLVDEVVVVQGGDSVLYGTNAMGAAILLRSRWLDREGWEVSSDGAVGSFNTLSGTATLLVREGPWNGALAVHALRTDGHRDGAGGAVFVIHGAGRRRLGNWLLTLRDKAIHVTGGDPGTVDHPYTDHTFEVWRDNVSATAEYQDPGVRVTMLPYATVGRHELYDGFRSLDWTVGGTVEVRWQPGPGWDLLLGLNAQNVDGTVGNRIEGTSTDVDGTTDLAVYQQVTWRPFGSLTLIGGSRELYSLKYGFVFLGKIGFRLDLPAGLYVRARGVRNFRQPTLRELYLPYPVANPDLKPEVSQNWDATFGFDDGDHFEASVTGFRSQASNLIKYFGAWPSAEVVNIDSLVVWGVEGRAAIRDLGPFSAQLSGLWQDVGRYTRQNPSAKLDFTLTASRQSGSHRVAASLSGEWEHGLYGNNYGRDRIPDVFFVDFAARYRYTDPGRTWSVEPYAVLRNLLDRRYEVIPGYRMPGFHVLAGLRMEAGP